MTKFFHFPQNKAGGFFKEDTDMGIGANVIIEANNAHQANKIAQSIGIYFEGTAKGLDSFCCGDRWHPVDDDGKVLPMLYDTPVSEFKEGLFAVDVFIHYLDGTIKETVFKCEQ